MERYMSLFGTIALLVVAYLLSTNRKRINFNLVLWGVGLQTVFALLILKTEPGRQIFAFFNDVIVGLLSLAQEGAGFVFGGLINNTVPVGKGTVGDAPLLEINQGMVAHTGAMFAFKVLPTIIFFSSLMAVLYHLGIMQQIVVAVARIMAYTMKTSGAESLSAAANIFVGQTEAPLVVKPYLAKMTNSELMAIMTGGMATVAGGVMAAYVAMLHAYFPDIAGHLMAASIMSAPAALLVAKMMVPETEEPETAGECRVALEQVDPNIIGAAARGASEGLQLALNVGGMLIAFIALIALLNAVINLSGHGVSYLIGMDPFGLTVSRSNVTEEVIPGDRILVKKSGSLSSDLELKVTEVKNDGQEKLKIRFASDKPIYQAMSNLEFSIVGRPAGEVERAKKEMEASKRRGLQMASQGASILDSIPEIEKGRGNSLAFQGGLNWTMSALFGLLFAPVAWLMGVPWKDANTIGLLFGEKIVLNEFVAYGHLAQILAQEAACGIQGLSERSIIIATYALCGFANFSSIAIQIGGIGALAPTRKNDLARLGLKSMIAGTIAAFMTATIAGMII